MFHPVSLVTNVDSAKLLAFSYSRAHSELQESQHAMCDLTAVVEDGLTEEDERIQFAMKALGES